MSNWIATIEQILQEPDYWAWIESIRPEKLRYWLNIFTLSENIIFTFGSGDLYSDKFTKYSCYSGITNVNRNRRINKGAMDIHTKILHLRSSMINPRFLIRSVKFSWYDNFIFFQNYFCSFFWETASSPLFGHFTSFSAILTSGRRCDVAACMAGCHWPGRQVDQHSDDERSDTRPWARPWSSG